MGAQVSPPWSPWWLWGATTLWVAHPEISGVDFLPSWAPPTTSTTQRTIPASASWTFPDVLTGFAKVQEQNPGMTSMTHFPLYIHKRYIYIYIIWQYHDAIFIIDINLIVGVKDEIFPCGSWRDQCSSHTSNNQGQKNGSKRFWRWFYTPKKLTARTWKKWKVGRWVSFCQGIILAFWSVNFPMGFCKKSLTLANPVIVLDDDQGV